MWSLVIQFIPQSAVDCAAASTSMLGAASMMVAQVRRSNADLIALVLVGIESRAAQDFDADIERATARFEARSRRGKIRELQTACDHPPCARAIIRPAQDRGLGSAKRTTTFHCSRCDRRWTEHVPEQQAMDGALFSATYE